MEDTSRKVLFVDNFDSFTYNLVDDFCKRNCQAKVYRADTSVEDLDRVAAEFVPDLLVISPGPGREKKDYTNGHPPQQADLWKVMANDDKII